MNLIKHYPVTLSLMLLIILFTVLITQSLEPQTAKAATVTTQLYTVTDVVDNDQPVNDEYYAESNDPNDNLYFTSDEIQSVGQLSEGDLIKATFDEYGELLSVSKLHK